MTMCPRGLISTKHSGRSKATEENPVEDNANVPVAEGGRKNRVKIREERNCLIYRRVFIGEMPLDHST